MTTPTKPRQEIIKQNFQQDFDWNLYHLNPTRYHLCTRLGEKVSNLLQCKTSKDGTVTMVSCTTGSNKDVRINIKHTESSNKQWRPDNRDLMMIDLESTTPLHLPTIVEKTPLPRPSPTPKPDMNNTNNTRITHLENPDFTTVYIANGLTEPMFNPKPVTFTFDIEEVRVAFARGILHRTIMSARMQTVEMLLKLNSTIDPDLANPYQ